MPGTIQFHDHTFLPRRPAMVRQKTRDAFIATTSHKQKLAAQDTSTSTSLEVSYTYLSRRRKLIFVRSPSGLVLLSPMDSTARLKSLL